jgi:hypothetical protein
MIRREFTTATQQTGQTGLMRRVLEAPIGAQPPRTGTPDVKSSPRMAAASGNRGPLESHKHRRTRARPRSHGSELGRVADDVPRCAATRGRRGRLHGHASALRQREWDATRPKRRPRHLGADEIHRGKAQKFYTVLSDLVHGKVMGLAPCQGADVGRPAVGGPCGDARLSAAAGRVSDVRHPNRTRGVCRLSGAHHAAAAPTHWA